MRKWVIAACGSALAMACTDQRPKPDMEEQRQAEEHRAPRGEGGALDSNKSFALSTDPILAIDETTPEADRTDLEGWIEEALAVLASEKVKTNMAALKVDYAKVWQSAVLGFADTAGIHTLLSAPASPNRYVATRVLLDGTASETGIGVDADPDSDAGARLMTIGRGHLQRYRSSNAVEKSCAINSLVHEITHTLSRSSTQFYYAVTDTGSGTTGAGSGPMASYLVGSIAQCTQLEAAGRIKADGLRQCITAFGLRPKFPAYRCDDFEADEAVKWPKDPKPKPG